MRSLRIAFSVALLCVTLLPLQAFSAPQPARSALILFDDEGEFGWLGEMYAIHLENMLSHFDLEVSKKPFSEYAQGDLENFDATFYLGTVYKATPLPADFRDDLAATQKTFVWMGQNLWRYALDLNTWFSRPEFEEATGLRYLEFSYDTHPTVTFKGQELIKDVFDPGLARMHIVDGSKVEVFGECHDEYGNSWPYIVRGGANFWVVPDMPMISNDFRDRLLVFADVLYDILGHETPVRHRAVLRIEDVHPNTPLPLLRGIRDVLARLQIPFVISLIPEYHDPLGHFNDDVPQQEFLEPGTPFAEVIQELVDIGGQIVQHGTTHQFGEIPNPYTGVSGDDYEFYWLETDTDGNLIYIGPLPGQDAKNVRQRILNGYRRIQDAGFAPVGWLTPHYLGSEVSYQQFARLYPFALDRGIFVVTDSHGDRRRLELNSPYIYRDIYGLKRIPETIGYIDPYGWAPAGVILQPPSLPADLVERARALKVVRNSWAGCYFHWYLDPALLEDLVNGIKAEGFEFTPIHGDLK